MKKTASKKRFMVVPEGYDAMLSSLAELLESARRVSARAVNSVITATYWEVGRRIVEHEQHGKRRAGYGDALLERLSTDLMARFGRGFSRQNLHKYRQFFLSYPEIRPTVSGESPMEKCPTSSGESLPNGEEKSIFQKIPENPGSISAPPLLQQRGNISPFFQEQRLWQRRSKRHENILNTGKANQANGHYEEFHHAVEN